MKRMLSLVVSMLLTLVMTTSCSKTTNNKDANTASSEKYVADSNLNPPGQFPVCKEKIKLTIGLPKNVSVTDFNDNAYTKYLEEKMNMEFDFMFFPANQQEARQKLELMAAAGGKEFPDVLVGFDLSIKSLYSYGTSGLIVPLTKYYENSSYYLKQVLEKEPNINAYITMSNGEIYSIPRVIDSLINTIPVYLWMYQPWLDRLGLKAPETTEEFKNVLQAFKDKDPNKNGVSDEIPMLGATDDVAGRYFTILMTPFIPTDTAQYYFYVDENEKVHAAYIEPEWKEGLKYIRDLCTNGLLSPMSFTTSHEQFNQIMRNSETLVGSMVAAPYMLEANDPRRKEYKIVGPLEGPGGTKRSMYYPLGVANHAFIVTKNCQYPEAAFRLGDLMCSDEASTIAYIGKEGVDWVKPEPNDVGRFETIGFKPVYKQISKVMVDLQKSNWGSYIHAGYIPSEITMGMVNISEEDPVTDELCNKFRTYYDLRYNHPLMQIYAVEDVDRVEELKALTSTYVNEMTMKFITGRADIDAEWDSYIKTLKDIGVDELIQIQQKTQDRCKSLINSN